MTFISYAQNFEDLMLWRALKDVERGFYVDVGAHSPDLHSVTKAFYERGWRGINVEPHPKWHAALSAARPRDVNLRVAVAAGAGTVPFFTIGETGLSTTDEAIAAGHSQHGFEAQATQVEARTLASIVREHVARDQPVHFLKVDVEGGEADVIAGADWSVFRPWIVVVEATLPLSVVESFQQWESALVAAGYEHVYSDGLNRFYLAQEQLALRPVFRYPPNPFDDWRLAESVRLEAAIAEAGVAHAHLEADRIRAESLAAALLSERDTLQGRVAELESNAVANEQALANAHNEVSAIRRERDAMLGSRSWRITRPLRLGSHFALRLGSHFALRIGPLFALRAARPILVRVWVEASKSQRLKAWVHATMRASPRLAVLLAGAQRRLRPPSAPAPAFDNASFVSSPTDLSNEAKDVLDLLTRPGDGAATSR